MFDFLDKAKQSVDFLEMNEWSSGHEVVMLKKLVLLTNSSFVKVISAKSHYYQYYCLSDYQCRVNWILVWEGPANYCFTKRCVPYSLWDLKYNINISPIYTHLKDVIGSCFYPSDDIFHVLVNKPPYTPAQLRIVNLLKVTESLEELTMNERSMLRNVFVPDMRKLH